MPIPVLFSLFSRVGVPTASVTSCLGPFGAASALPMVNHREDKEKEVGGPHDSSWLSLGEGGRGFWGSRRTAGEWGMEERNLKLRLTQSTL